MTTFRERIIGLARSLKLSREEFTVGPFIDWPAIQKKIESRFVMKTRSDLSPLEWPENFKGKSQVIPSKAFAPFEYLDELLPDNELYWFILPDNSMKEPKLWLFQGYIRAIQKVLSQLPETPFYVIAKKYEWLLYNNRKDEFIALGQLPDKPAAFHESEVKPEIKLPSPEDSDEESLPGESN